MSSLNNPSAAQRDDGSLSAAELIARYSEGPTLLRASYAGVTAQQLGLRPIADKWSMMEVLCHLADCEQFFADRIKRTLGTNRPLLIGVDGSGYPQPVRYHERDAEEEISLIAITRSQTARILRLIEPEAWHRQAIHSETGLVSVRGLLLHAINHQAHHLRFVDEKRAALGLALSGGS